MTTLSTREVLQRARALIDDPSDWAQGEDVNTGRGGPWCAGSAMEWMAWDFGIDQQNEMFRVFHSVIGDDYRNVPDWNDAPERTHGEVLAAFDEAIRRAGP